MASSDANFLYNVMLAKALVQLIPAHEKPPVRKWFSKLLELDSSPKEMEIRDEYMFFMLMMLQCQKIREPFNRPPPSHIEPLRDLVDTKVYEEIHVANGDNMNLSWIDKSGLDQSASGDPDSKFGSAAPSKFFSSQPVPQEGIICYIAAFSDQRYP